MDWLATSAFFFFLPFFLILEDSCNFQILHLNMNKSIIYLLLTYFPTNDLGGGLPLNWPMSREE